VVNSIGQALPQLPRIEVMLGLGHNHRRRVTDKIRHSPVLQVPRLQYMMRLNSPAMAPRDLLRISEGDYRVARLPEG